MKIERIETEIFILDVPQHQRFKERLLSYIDEMPNQSFEGVTKSDWNLPVSTERKYLRFFYTRMIGPCMNKLKNYLKAKEWGIANGWFQQYGKNSEHTWHIHADANWANSYFLELPDPAFKTEIKIKDKIIEYEVKEGQLICFPAYLLHRSKPNGDQRKTAIAFNSHFPI